MAVTKIWAIHDSVSRVVDYCSNPEKTRLTGRLKMRAQSPLRPLL